MGVEGVLSKSVASFEGPRLVFEGELLSSVDEFYPQLMNVMQKKYEKEKPQYLSNPYCLPFICIFVVKCAWYYLPYDR